MEKRYHFKIKGISPLLMDKFNGLKEEAELKEKSDSIQAEAHAYRISNGNLGFPGIWLKGCLSNYSISQTSRDRDTTKDQIKMRIRSRIYIEPIMMDLNTKEYEIYKRPVFNPGKLSDIKTTPRINEWSVEGTLITTLEKSEAEIHKDFENSGTEIGVGGDRVDGYGRFKVISFEMK